MRLWKCFDGSLHPVSDRWLAEVPTDLDGKPFTEVDGERIALMNRGMDLVDAIDEAGNCVVIPRFFPDRLTKEEGFRLDGATHVLNLNRALQWLNGRDYREIFGPDATLDQVHGQQWRPDTCRCAISQIFDHWVARDNPAAVVVHPHPFRTMACPKHRRFNDVGALYAAVLAENRAKNLRGLN